MDDISIIRDLAKRYLDICDASTEEPKRKLWREHNSLRPAGRTPIYVRAFAWGEMPESKLLCQDSLLRGVEGFLRESLFRHSFRDDFIFEPYVTIQAMRRCEGWGLASTRNFADENSTGAFKEDYALKELSDIERLRVPFHAIDEDATAIAKAKVETALGGLLTVNVDRAPAYRMWSGDISTDLGHLRGIENIMMDMMDNPEWLHRLCGFMRDGILKAHDEAEAAGDWGLSAHQNQSMAYSSETRDPAANVNGVNRDELWCFMASQEFTAVSPEMFDEFLLQYQLPILKRFKLVAYGCCEDLSRKISSLRKIPNLRRIAVSPFANVGRCAEQIGRDYVLSYRPSPADMVAYGFDSDRVRRILRRDLALCKGCIVDITLKDVETVQGDPDRVRHWVEIARDVSGEFTT